jgi:predicted O-methyltransferase YrrM
MDRAVVRPICAGHAFQDTLNPVVSEESLNPVVSGESMLLSASLEEILGQQPYAFTVLGRDAFVNGNVAPNEINVIAALVSASQPQIVFEIGTFDGRTSLNMAANAPASARIYTLDLPADQAGSTILPLEINEELFINKPSSGGHFTTAPLGKKITQLYGDSRCFDFSPYIDSVDFMFIDGSHSYEYVVSDTKNALKMVRRGGVIIWHDYVPAGFTPFPGVPRALKEFYLTDWRFRGLRHIAGTSIVYLKVPKIPQNVSFVPGLAGNSSQPKGLLAGLFVSPRRITADRDEPIEVRVAALNLGYTLWLPSDSPTGAVRLGTRLLDEAGVMIDDNYWRNELPFRRGVFPGEAVDFEASIPDPPDGARMLDFDLVAEGVAWFNIPRGLGLSISLPARPK